MKAIKKAAGEKIHEVLFRTYSEDVKGYSIHIAGSGHYIIINSILPEPEADKTYYKLLESSARHPERRFILLQSDGNLFMTDDLNFLEKSDSK